MKVKKGNPDALLPSHIHNEESYRILKVFVVFVLGIYFLGACNAIFKGIYVIAWNMRKGSLCCSLLRQFMWMRKEYTFTRPHSNTQKK